MHIILTRPIDDSLELISKFKILGHMVTHLPLLNIIKLEYKKINFLNYKAIIFTSANAIKFLKTEDVPKNILCFCVGEATERKARSLGFLNVISSGGNVETLKELIFRMHEKIAGKLIYISGEFITTDLDKILISSGYTVDRIINYSATPIEYIDKNIVNKIKKNSVDMMFVYSEKSAINLKSLIKKYSLADEMTKSNLMCISKKASKVLEFIKWKKTIFFNPGEEEFFLSKIN